jgi:hypothetical protein
MKVSGQPQDPAVFFFSAGGNSTQYSLHRHDGWKENKMKPLFSLIIFMGTAFFLKIWLWECIAAARTSAFLRNQFQKKQTKQHEIYEARSIHSDCGHLVNEYQFFEGMYCLHLQGQRQCCENAVQRQNTRKLETHGWERERETGREQ